MNLIPVILCGGAGPRLWPVCRELHPKSFIRLAHGQSLLQKAFLRGAELPGIVDILTVTNRELFFKTNVAVVSCAIGLSDIGSWSALGDLAHPDADGNRIEGEALLHDVTHTYIRSGERIGGTVGVDNMTIIDTPDALLVADRSRAQDVKHRYAELKAQGHEAHELHRTVHRPWGT